MVYLSHRRLSFQVDGNCMMGACNLIMRALGFHGLLTCALECGVYPRNLFTQLECRVSGYGELYTLMVLRCFFGRNIEVW